VRPVTLTRVMHCRASRETVWKRIADTLRLNRYVGNSALDVKERETDDTYRFELRCRIAGFRVSYLEHPYEFVEGELMAFHRVMLDGPARTITTRYELADAPATGGCDVTVGIDVMPRAWLLRPFMWLATARTLAALERYVSGADGAGSETVISCAVAERAVDAARSRVGADHPRELIDRLVAHLRSADDLELAPIRPFALATAWSVDRNALLRLCLAAVPAGLLDLRWGVLCPSCRTHSQVLPSLRDLDRQAHCHACDLRFDTELDRAVEALFLPHPSVRRVETRPFCIAGPALTPHVVAQVALEKGARGTLGTPAEPCRVRLFVRGGATALVDVVDGGSETATVAIHAQSVSPAHVSVRPRGKIELSNESGAGRHAKIERTEFLFNAATAHHVTTMAEFRRLFGAEALRPGLALRISHVAILFSDLCGSTALYSRIGDAAAFGVVTDCFRYGTSIVQRHGGTVVKTMGDAVMAAFTSSAAAVAAGAEMLERWPELVENQPAARALDLKIGINAGPCTIVTANGGIDYFGQTVNGAARLLHLAGEREAVLAEGLVEALPPGAQVVERRLVRVKGIDEPIPVARVRVAVPGARVASV